jgi:2-dehydro-3-deoxyphosphooctonate aldolase (KDO 8-P synthase)
VPCAANQTRRSLGRRNGNLLAPEFSRLFEWSTILICVTHPFDIGPVPVGRGKLFLIAGPCVIESETHARTLADAIQKIAADLHIPYIFKASYDKANRTSIRSFRGPGLIEGARILRSIAQGTELPVLTDVHTPEDCLRLSKALGDIEAVIQIPAFLCRQTDLLVAAAHTGRAINIKKGQFVAPLDMQHAVLKVRDTAASLSGSKPARVFLTERGASFGYNNLVVDMRSLPIMHRFAPVVFDATHSVQTPSAANGVSGGQPEFIPVLARAAVAAGVDGIFLEVHDDPTQAKSDGANALRLDKLKPLLEKLLAVHAAVS